MVFEIIIKEWHSDFHVAFSNDLSHNKNKHEMNFIPNKHELYLFNLGIWERKRERKQERKQEREREREREREKFYVINVKYKEISWRVRRGGGGQK